MNVLVDIRAVRGGEILLFIDEEQRRIDKICAVLHGSCIHGHQQFGFFPDGDVEPILYDRGFPADFAISFLGRQLHGL